MMGKQFAVTDESAAKKLDRVGGRVARYRGQASEAFQLAYYDGWKEGTVAEGEELYPKVWGTAGDYIDYLSGALRSAFNYGGAQDVYELQRKCRGNFWSVSDGYKVESGVRE